MNLWLPSDNDRITSEHRQSFKNHYVTYEFVENFRACLRNLTIALFANFSNFRRLLFTNFKWLHEFLITFHRKVKTQEH